MAEDFDVEEMLEAPYKKDVSTFVVSTDIYSICCLFVTTRQAQRNNAREIRFA